MTETIIRRRIEVLADEPLIAGIERIAASAGIELPVEGLKFGSSAVPEP